jgi:antitoxin ParD1/3/4
MTQRDGRERRDGENRSAPDEVARRRRREVLRAEDLSDADLAAITNGEMDPRHRHLDGELEHAALEAWDSHEAKAARVVQAGALKEQAGKGGLRFEAYLPPGLAEWLLDLIERGVFVDPSEAVFVILGEHRDLEPHADLRRELLSCSCQAAMDDPRPSMSGEEVEKHLQELPDTPLPESAVWRKTT